ncbi:AAA family ATPase [Actinomadura graeca]|uniref:AAA family ATPase n=1 Tax=Actinomadura graeca TaxID=2750812 RepID=A0ABX8R2R0_9ACTN|nr:helix-turn-helix transcriptional regulator [Actinomadura graeca]QXJ23288.1 AAA family ATPase [Actinomadura graeca]
MVASVVSPVLVGREPETAALRAAYEQAVRRRPVTALVSGEAGIGKSRLVTGVVRALPGDPLVLSGGCLELGSKGVPYVPFVAILRGLVRRLGRDGVAAMLPPSGSALGDWLPELGPAPARYPRIRLLEEMLGLVTAVSSSRPTVLIVEDLHWADASSRDLFAYLVRNLVECPVLLIGTVRTGEHPNRRLLAELARGDQVTRLRLGPLEHRHVADMLAAIGGHAPDRVRAARIYGRSGGNPLFVEALSNADETPADDLRTLLLNRVADLPGPARDTLAILAVAGEGLTEDTIREAGTEPALHDLMAHDLVVVREDRFVLRHDLIREVVYDSLLPVRRRELHARYAATLPAGSTASAEHWLAADRPDRALPAAWDAAARAARQNAYDEQLHLLDMILTHGDGRFTGADRTDVLETAATAAYAAGRSAAGVAHSTAALDALGPGASPERVAALLGMRGRLQNRIDGTGRDDLERAVALLPPGTADALRSELLSALAFIGVGALRDEESRRHASEALTLADAVPDDALRAPALLVLATLDGMAGHGDAARRAFAEARRAAEAAGDEHTFLTTFQWEAADLIEVQGRYADAADLAHAGLEAARRLGRTRSRGSMLAVVRAVPLSVLGRWDEALDVVADALAGSPPPLYAAFLRLVAADIARCRGETDRFEELFRELTEFAQHARGAEEAKADLAVQHVAWLLDQGHLEAADHMLGDYLAAGRRPRDVLRLAVLGARLQRARRAAAPRNKKIADEAAARSAWLTRLVGEIGETTPVLDAHRLTFQAETASGGLPAWDRAAAAWRDLGNRYETATVLTGAANTALASNNRPGARSRLNTARAIAADLGAAPLLARIDELAARGRLEAEPAAPVRNDFGLTRRELDVLRVLARGRSNAQIAAELFISSNTAATHVARILDKLGVSTRTEAVTRAHETGLLNT